VEGAHFFPSTLEPGMGEPQSIHPMDHNGQIPIPSPLERWTIPVTGHKAISAL